MSNKASFSTLFCKYSKMIFLFIVISSILLFASALSESSYEQYQIIGSALVSWHQVRERTYISIPSVFNGREINSIGIDNYEYYELDWNFDRSDFDEVKVLTIGEGIQKIYTPYVFEELQYVKFPESLTYIGGSSFRDLDKLTTVIFPNAEFSFGVFTFSGCDSLTSVYLKDTKITDTGYGTFSDCPNLTYVSLPETLDRLGHRTFEDCTSLTQIEIPENCQYIDYGVFWGCTSLTQIEIPENCQYIDSDAFRDCESLERVTILSMDTEFFVPEEGVPDYIGGGDIFLNCPNLTIHCLKGSTADKYAQMYGIPIKYIDAIGTMTLSANGAKVESLDYACGNYMLPEAMDPDCTELDVDISVKRIIDIKKEEQVLVKVVLPDGFSFKPHIVEKECPSYKVDFAAGQIDKTIHLPNPVYMTAASEEWPEKLEFKLYLSSIGKEYPEDEEPKPNFTLTIPISWREDECAITCPGTKGLTENSEFDLFPDVDFADLIYAAPNSFDEGIMQLTSALSFSAYNQSMIENSLHNLGFTRVQYNGNSGTSGVASIFACKTYVADDTVKNLILVIIRGTSGYEWVGNFLIEGTLPEHEDFSNSKSTVLNLLKTWMSRHSNSILPSQSFCLVTGHSRGAAVANLLTHELNTSEKNLFNKVAGYTYATPNVIKKGNEQKDSNLFNIVYRHDVVGYVPQDYAKHGITYALGTDKDDVPSDVEDEYEYYTERKYRAPNQPLIVSIVLNSQHYVNNALTIHRDIIGKILNGDSVPETDLSVAHCAENYLAWIYTTGNSSFADMEKVQQNMGGLYQKVIGKGVSFALDAIGSGVVSYEYAQILYKIMLGMILNGVDQFNTLFIGCPVDVTVYDNTGTAIAVIRNHEVISYNSDKLDVVCYEDTDFLFIPANTEYTIEIIGNGDGTMDIGIVQIELDGSSIKYDDRKTFNNLRVAAGQKFELPLITSGSITSQELIIGTAPVKQTMYLPSELKIIKNGAFAGSVAVEVIVADGIESIGSNAFANMPQLEILKILSMNVSLPADILESSPNAVIYCYQGSQAESDAINYGLAYAYIVE